MRCGMLRRSQETKVNFAGKRSEEKRREEKEIGERKKKELKKKKTE